MWDDDCDWWWLLLLLLLLLLLFEVPMIRRYSWNNIGYFILYIVVGYRDARMQMNAMSSVYINSEKNM